MRRGGPWLRLAITSALALAVAVMMVPILRPATHEQAMRRALFSADEATRGEAIAFFQTPIDPESPLSRARIFAVPGLADRLDHASDEVLLSLHDAFAGTGAFASEFPRAHFRAVDLKYEKDGDAEYALAQVAGAGRDAPRDLIERVLASLLENESSEVRLSALEHACWRLGDGAGTFVAGALRDEEARVRRFVWLCVPHAHGLVVDIAEGTSEIDLDVTEAMALARVLGGEARESSHAFARALLDSSDEAFHESCLDEFEGVGTHALRERIRDEPDHPDRARWWLVTVAREPTDGEVDQALLLGQEGLVGPEDLLVTLFSAGRAREAMRVLLDRQGDRRLDGPHRAILVRFFDPAVFRIPVPSGIPDGTESFAFEALRAWWLCVGNRLDFDETSRTYRFASAEERE